MSQIKPLYSLIMMHVQHIQVQNLGPVKNLINTNRPWMATKTVQPPAARWENIAPNARA